ncbi:MAG: NAD(P)-dependent oxidoreductase [Propioniciclava sp.]|uniref:precorrin-2 dehydrogenase/sirohydrochlorin ferrochelatase family protein n=1 Tax=Propioniciclava sp. TaxID=2038686 RepID=UPI0039E2C53F
MSGSPVYLAGLDLRGRRVLVAGAGKVATRRIPALVSAGADVHVVAPAATATVRAWADSGAITWSRRRVAVADINGCWYVMAVTNVPQVNSTLVAEATRARIFCVRGDDGRAGTARTPATGAVDDLTIAAIGDRDPVRSRTARDIAVAAVAASGKL